MPSPGKSNRGGDRSAAAAARGSRIGRPKKEKKPIAKANVASTVLASINEVKYWREFLHADKKLADLNATERKEARETLEKLTNRRDGLPMQMQEEKIIFDPDQPLRVLIEAIGYPKK